MLAAAFYWLVNMTIYGSAAGLLVLALGRIRRLPRQMVFCLWLVPLLRFLLPLGVPNPASLMQLAARFTGRVVPALGGRLTAMNALMAADGYAPLTFGRPGMQQALAVAGLAWAVGAALAILTAGLLYRRAYRGIGDAQRIAGNLYCSRRAAAPALYGILRPRIVLPPDLDPRIRPYAILHEQAHAARRDNLWRCVAILVCCLHWFNPLCWLLLLRFWADMEFACDERVLRRLGAEEGRAYARALLGAGQAASGFAAPFGGAKLRPRLERILTYRRLSHAAALACMLLFLALFVLLATNATF